MGAAPSQVERVPVASSAPSATGLPSEVSPARPGSAAPAPSARRPGIRRAAVLGAAMFAVALAATGYATAMSGPAKEYGRQMKLEIEAAFQRANPG